MGWKRSAAQDERNDDLGFKFVLYNRYILDGSERRQGKKIINGHDVIEDFEDFERIRIAMKYRELWDQELSMHASAHLWTEYVQYSPARSESNNLLRK